MSTTTAAAVNDANPAPKEVLNRLNIIDIQIKTFSGYLTREDQVFEDGQEILFTKGSIKVIDPAHVRPFNNSRTGARRIASAVGVSLAGGYAVSDEHTKDVIEKLIILREKFYREKAIFLDNYAAFVQEQANQKPEFYDMVMKRRPEKSYVDSQLQFEIRVYKMVASEIEGVGNYINDEVGDLKWQLAKEIAQDIKDSLSKDWATSADGKASGKTIGVLKRVRDKLKSLIFLDRRVAEVERFISEAIGLLPSGTISGRDYMFLVGIFEILRDPKRLLSAPLDLSVMQGSLQIENDAKAAAQDVTNVFSTVSVVEPKQKVVVPAVKEEASEDVYAF